MKETAPKTLSQKERIELAQEHGSVMRKIADLAARSAGSMSGETYKKFKQLTDKKTEIEIALGHRVPSEKLRDLKDSQYDRNDIG